MSLLPRNIRLVYLPIILLFSSCVKDVDLDQASDIVIPPTATVDIVYFTLKQTDFEDQNGTPKLQVSDQTRLNFLSDDYIQNDLQRADFKFRCSNSFSRDVVVTISFLSENNSEKYRFYFAVPAGNSGNSKTVEYTEIMQGASLTALKKSIKLKIEVSLDSGTPLTNGDFQLKSKADFHFEF